MSRSISNLLNTHPVSRNDNLRTIALALDLNPPLDHKKAQLQSAIEDFLKSETDLEAHVRDIAQTIIHESKQVKSNECDVPMDTGITPSSLTAIPSTATLSRSPIRVVSIPTPSDNTNTQQDLFDQSHSNVNCDSQTHLKLNIATNLNNELKRKLFITGGVCCDSDGNDDDDDDDYDDGGQPKRSRVEPYESIQRMNNTLTTMMLSEREERQRDRLLSKKENEFLRSKLDSVLTEIQQLRVNVSQIHETILVKEVNQQQPHQPEQQQQKKPPQQQKNNKHNSRNNISRYNSSNSNKKNLPQSPLCCLLVIPMANI